MLRHGLAASLRGLTHGKPSCTAFQRAVANKPRQTFTLSSSWILPRALQSARPLTTSGSLAARLNLSSRRREPVRVARTTRSAPVEDDVRLVEDDATQPPPSDAQQPSIPRALLFLFGFSTLSFAGAAYYSLKDTEHVAAQLRSSRDVFANISSFFTSSSDDNAAGSAIWGAGVTEKRLMAAKNHETATRLGLRMDWLVGWCNQLGLPAGVTEFVGRSYLIAAENYLELSPSQKAVLPVVVANSAVFVLWTVASARHGGGMWRLMNANFLHRPSTNAMRTMLTSVFSHQAFLHFLFNNVALWSIGGSALYYASHQAHGRIAEASQTPHFLAFFATAGVFAATVSHVVAAVRFRRVSALHGLEMARRTLGRQGSLGSSGAVYSALVMSALAFPDAQVGIIFLPFITLPIGIGVAGLVAADVAGIVLRWRLFDHWAHLGGAAFGAFYWYYGAQAWQSLKRALVDACAIGSNVAPRLVEVQHR